MQKASSPDLHNTCGPGHAAWSPHRAHLVLVRRQSGLCLRQAVKDCLWAFATLNHVPPAIFLSTSEQHCIATLGDFTSQNVANAMWAFQKLGHSPTQQLLNMVDDQACSPPAWGPVQDPDTLFLVGSPVADLRETESHHA